MAFQEFKPTRHKDKRPKLATAIFRDRFYLNKHSKKLFNLDKYDYVSLFYDDQKNIMGIKLHEEKQKESNQKIIKLEQANSIAIKKFIKFFNIRTPYGSVFLVKQKGDLLCIDLNEPLFIKD